MHTYPIKERVSIVRSTALIWGIFFAMIAFWVPMDILGMNYMFTVHIVQHLLLSLVVPPLLLLGIAPESLSRFLAHHHVLARCLKYLLFPFVTSALY